MTAKMIRQTIVVTALLCAVACVEDSSEPGISGAESDGAVTVDAGSAQGEGGDAAAPDLNADSAVGAPDGGGEMSCDAVCDRLVECGAELCADASALVLRASCRMQCLNQEDFAPTASGIVECQELVEFVSQRSPDVGQRCGLSSGDPRCEAYSVRATECMNEVCPNAAEVGSGITGMFRSICTDQVGSGRWPADQLEDLENAPCIRPIIGGTIDFLTRAGAAEGSGGLQTLCETGPRVPAETCDAACQVLDTCIPEGTPDEMGGAFGRYGDCRFICGLFEDPRPDIWACVSENEECEAAFRCFEAPPPAVPECVEYSTLIASCTIESCAPAAEFRDGLALVARGGCDEEVADGRATVEQIEARTAAQDCADVSVAAYVDFFINQTVEGSGFLAGVCSEMPQVEAELCRAACSNLSPCIPEDADANASMFRDPSFCELVCATSVDIPLDTWTCLSTTQMCQAAFMCFGP